MHVQINTDHNIEGREALAIHVKGVVENALDQLSDQITRVEVHLSEQSGDKTEQDDTRCVMEARLEGRQPTAVTHQAMNVDEAVYGAAMKLRRSIENALQRIEHHR